MDAADKAVELVRQLLDPRFAPSANTISQNLLDLQLSRDGWAVADSLLNSPDANLQFYGALSFQVKLNRGLTHSLTQADADAVLGRLLAALFTYVHNGGPNRVLDKICSALATYFVQTPAPWNHAVGKTAARLLQGHNDTDSDLPESLYSHLSSRQVQALLRLCRCFAEDLTRVEAKTAKGHQIEQAFKTCVPAFQALVSATLSSQQIASQEVVEEALSAYSAWASYAISHWQHEVDTCRALQAMTDVVMKLLIHQDFILAMTTANALADVLSHDSKFINQEQLSHLWPLISQAQETWADESDEDRVPLSKLVAAWAKTMIPQIQQTPDLPVFRDVLTQLTQSIFGVDWAQDGCAQLDIASDFWTEFVDHLVDYEVDMDDGRKQRFHSILDPVIEAYFDALDRKDDLTMSKVDSDYQDAWKAARADFGDIMTKLMETDFIPVYGICAVQLEQAYGRQDWYRIEAVLQLLNDMSNSYDGVPSSEQGLARTFNSDLFSHLLQPQSLHQLSARIKRLLVRLIDNYSTYFQEAPALIPPVVTLLMAIMEQNLSRESVLADLAAKCLASICEKCRKVLVAIANDLLSFCDRALASDHLSAYQREKIYGGMAYVVQALPKEKDKVHAVKLLIEKVYQDLQAAEQLLNHGQTEIAEQKMVTDFQCLASIGKALHSDQRQVIELDDSPPPTNGHSENPWEIGEGTGVPIRVIDCLRFIQLIPTSGDAWEGVCSVLRVGLSSTEPGPFVFPPSLISSFLSSMTPSTPRLEALLTTACAFVSAHSRTTHLRVPADVSTILSSIVQILLSLPSPNSDPVLAQQCTDFLERLLPRYSDVLLSLPSQPLEALLHFELRAFTSDEPMLKRTVASFLAALLGLGSAPTSPPAARELTAHLVAPLAAAVAHQIGGHAQRSELDAVAKVLRAVMQSGPGAKGVLEQALHGESWPVEAKVVEAEKRAFVQRVVMLRGGRGTAEAVKEFWAKARGTVGSY
ncbi:hypothetical protein K461DRAFT_290444 [Myriangium duriaei CBS 260.36]|uniref:Importin N-terminal domain-containing protein n=1 Tax=Myriangium duriaei CBS 260.36 TaxID=1168546 RepID=A0A9P4JAA6_9PEZI|nr:hypothetical protein K461DRAFT_290444 [Myriangium duriaei CBS 260.36]